MERRYRLTALRQELEAIAGDELHDVLDDWNHWTPEQERRLASYLRSEMAPYGMLSNEKARENDQSLSQERADGRKLLSALEYSARRASMVDPSCPYCAPDEPCYTHYTRTRLSTISPLAVTTWAIWHPTFKGSTLGYLSIRGVVVLRHITLQEAREAYPDIRIERRVGQS